ncbi:MAG: hypothetical protein FWF18_05760 [Dehalococcoidia bacterium]|nr:hypothetical protein [Dehalococcoidia bacterium]
MERQGGAPVQGVGDTRPKVISFQFRTSPSWRERSDQRIWWRGVTIHLLRMLRHSQARSSSMDLRTSPSWRERSDRRIWWRGATIHHPTGCFVTRRLVPPAWIYDQVHPGGSAATEGSGGGE